MRAHEKLMYSGVIKVKVMVDINVTVTGA